MYNYLKVLPQEYTTNLESTHYLLDVKKISELKTHYNRGWESNENLRQFPKRLNEEQDSLIGFRMFSIEDVLHSFSFRVERCVVL